MESWRNTWRLGFAPVLPPAGLLALRTALADDDPRLLQGATTTPPPMVGVRDWPVEMADPIAFACWQGDDLTTVGEVELAFARACYEADQKLKEPAACRYFLNWIDDTPRERMRRELLAEVELALSQRQPAEATP